MSNQGVLFFVSRLRSRCAGIVLVVVSVTGTVLSVRVPRTILSIGVCATRLKVIATIVIGSFVFALLTVWI
jgi:hypothetical protein